jgi:transcriptional regulator of met regulon
MDAVTSMSTESKAAGTWRWPHIYIFYGVKWICNFIPPYVTIWHLIKHRNNFTVPLFNKNIQFKYLSVFINSLLCQQQHNLSATNSWLLCSLFIVHCFCHCLTTDLIQRDRCNSIGCRNETYFTNCFLNVSRTKSSLTVTLWCKWGHRVLFLSYQHLLHVSETSENVSLKRGTVRFLSRIREWRDKN